MATDTCGRNETTGAKKGAGKYLAGRMRPRERGAVGSFGGRAPDVFFLLFFAGLFF